MFAVDIVFVLIKAERKRAALRAHWLDSAIVVVTVPLYGRLLSSLPMRSGSGSLAVLTATVASFFVKMGREDEHVAIANALAPIEADLAEVKRRLGPA